MANGAGGRPFSRWAEDVPGDDAPWLTAVRFYLEVMALPEAERAAALTDRRDTLRARRDDPVAQLLADDLDAQLAGPNKPLREALPLRPTATSTTGADTLPTAAPAPHR